jgi:Transglycosylase SLT domain
MLLMRQAISVNAIQRRWFLSIFFLPLFCSVALSQSVRLDPTAVERAKKYENYFSVVAEKYGVDAHLLWVIGYLETRFNPNAVSRKGARGLMQLMPTTARRFGGSDLYDPIAAIDAAARFLRYLSNRFKGKMDLILAAYSAGEETVDAYRTGRIIKVGSKIINPFGRVTGGIPPYRETLNYLKDGLTIHGLITGNTTSFSSSRTANGEKNPEIHSQPSKLDLRSILYISRTQTRPLMESSNRRSISYTRTVELP